MNVYTVLDAAAERYLTPFFSGTVEEAIRSFREACSSEGHQFAKFPEDYSLWKVGEWEAETGVLTPVAGQKLAMATSFVVGPRLEGTNDA